MDKFYENYNLRNHNTFKIQASTRYFYSFELPDEIVNFIKLKKHRLPANLPIRIMGGGSNILFSDNFNGLIIKPNNNGIEITDESETTITVKVQAGEVWDDVVKFAVERGFGGIENLSAIPGNCGGATTQNIGAYGMELAEAIIQVEAIELHTGKIIYLSKKDCEYGYRTSIFKTHNQYLVLSVVLLLQKKPVFNLAYKDLQAELSMHGLDVDLQVIRQAITNIRKRKLPDPDIIPNCGSFFKNPVVELSFAEVLQSKRNGLVYHQTSATSARISAAWLIEQCHWKGKRIGDAGVYDNHALILVNHGKANGKDIISLADAIRKSVFDTFGISLEYEVEVF